MGAAPAAKGAAGVQAAAGSSPSASLAFPAATPAVDVAAVLNGLASKNPEKLDWKRSIVDLMKLVGMDSSLAARKEHAKKSGYTGDQSDSVQMNV